MTTNTYTLRALSRQLKLDVRYLARALLGTPPDEIHGQRKRWRLSTVQAAVARHGHSQTGSYYNGGGNGHHANSEANRALDVVERAAAELQTALDKLATVPVNKRTQAAY